MGPIVILDKSVLQSLNIRAIPTLYKHYTVVHTDIILYEILADLTKEEIKDLVKKFYGKLSGMDSVFSLDYQTILLKNLLGEQFPMDGRPVVTANRVGNGGAIIDQRRESLLLLKWRSGTFDKED